MIRKSKLLPLLVASVVYSHFSYSSDIVFGQSLNAASDGMRWVMTNVLPQQMGLEVTNIFYRYTAVKDPDTGMIVYVQNEDAANEGEYVFREPTTDALTKAYGGGFLDKINQAEERAPEVLKEMVG